MQNSKYNSSIQILSAISHYFLLNICRILCTKYSPINTTPSSLSACFRMFALKVLSASWSTAGQTYCIAILDAQKCWLTGEPNPRLLAQHGHLGVIIARKYDAGSQLEISSVHPVDCSLGTHLFFVARGTCLYREIEYCITFSKS